MGDWWRKRRKKRYPSDPFDIFEEIREIMEEMMKEFYGSGPPSPFEDIEDFEKFFPKFKLPSGLEKKGPIVYGWSMTIGPDGKPQIRKFGNMPSTPYNESESFIKEEREPLVDIMETNTEVVIVAETPGVEKNEIKLKTTKNELEIKASDRFYKKMDLPAEVIPEQAKASYKNGVLEVRIPKLKSSKPSDDGTEISVE